MLPIQIKGFFFRKTFTDGDDFIQITIPPGAYEIESLNTEIRRIINDEEHFTDSDYPFQIKPNFSTLGSIIEILPQELVLSFVFVDSFRNLADKYVESFAGGNTWYVMETKDVISSISFKLKNENNELVSFNGQSISFRLSIKVI